ncbi:MAG: hypothetical protein AAFX06_08835 [Planctomycetota bacterium]
MDLPAEADPFDAMVLDATAFDADERSEKSAILARERPPSNVPLALRDCILVRPETGRGADAFVRFNETEDVGQHHTLTVSAERGAKCFTFVLFDIEGQVPAGHRIRHVYLLFTLLKSTPDEERDSQTWDCMVLREDAPRKQWSESGPKRITFDKAPAELHAVDLSAAGTLRGSLSKWYEDDRLMLLQLRNQQLADAVANDQDGLLTVMLRSRDAKSPAADFVSSEGPIGFGPCLAICVEPMDK